MTIPVAPAPRWQLVRPTSMRLCLAPVLLMLKTTVFEACNTIVQTTDLNLVFVLFLCFVL